ncbi:MAG: MFS transporter [Pseudomonadota bacterium]
MRKTQLIAFGALAIPLTGVTVPVTSFVPAFYGAQMGLSLATIGVALATLRVLDVFVDLAIGYSSDITKTRFGRRRPWIAAGIVLLFPAVWMTYAPPEVVDIRYLLIWVGLAYLGWSLVNIPYSAWSADLSSDPAERRRIAGWREFGHLAGTFIVLSVPFATALYGHGIDRFTMQWLAYVVCPLFLVGGFLTLRTPEKTDLQITRPNWTGGLRYMLSNKPFRQYVVFSFLAYLSSALVQATFVLYVAYYVASPKLAGPIFLAYFACAIVAVAPAVKASTILGKHKTMALCMLLWTLSFSAIAFLPPKEPAAFGFLFILSGAFSAAPLTLAPAILADVSDYAFMKTGRQEAGQYFAIWNTIQKATSAIGVGVALPLIGLLGFDPENVTEEGLEALRFVCFILPALPYGIAAFVIWRFPLTDRRQDIIRRKLLKVQA